MTLPDNSPALQCWVCRAIWKRVPQGRKKCGLQPRAAGWRVPFFAFGVKRLPFGVWLTAGALRIGRRVVTRRGRCAGPNAKRSTPNAKIGHHRRRSFRFLLPIRSPSHRRAALARMRLQTSPTFPPLPRLRDRLVRLRDADDFLDGRLALQHSTPAVGAQAFHAVGHRLILERAASFLADDFSA